jgi:hypothetical protein
MNAIHLSYLLLNTNPLTVQEIMIGADQIGLAVESTTNKAIYPKCQEESTQIHSTYMCYPTDLAWAE